jgi:hypothetical protein
MLANAELRGITVMPRNDTAEPLFAFDFALAGRSDINIKHVVSNIYTLMGFGEVVMRQPFMVDMIKRDPS